MTAKVKAKKAKSVKSIKNAGDGVVKESRRVRKQEKDLRFVRKLVENQTLHVQKTLSKKRKRRSKTPKGLDSLSSLLDSLPQPEKVIALPLKKQLTSKSHQKVVVEETNQLAAVLAHPKFQADPFAAIHLHLSNTLPTSDSPAKKPDGKGKKKKKLGRKKEVDLMDDLD